MDELFKEKLKHTAKNYERIFLEICTEKILMEQTIENHILKVFLFCFLFLLYLFFHEREGQREEKEHTPPTGPSHLDTTLRIIGTCTWVPDVLREVPGHKPRILPMWLQVHYCYTTTWILKALLLINARRKACSLSINDPLGSEKS